MDIDLSNLTDTELKILLRKVQRSLRELEALKRKRAKAELAEKAKEHGYTFAQLTGSKHRSGGDVKVVPRFADPSNPNNTWTGRGRKPKWFLDAVAAGIDPSSLLISSSDAN